MAVKGKTTIWVVTDGRAGNENPALGLAEATASRLRALFGASAAVVETKRIALRRPYALAPARLWDAVDAAFPQRRLRDDLAPSRLFAGLIDRGASLAPPFPDVAIGAGRRSAPIVAALRRMTGGGVRAVQIMTPQIPLDRFDLVVAPAHDRLRGENVLSTRGALHRLTPETLATRDPRVDRLQSPKVGVLLGGPSGSAGVDPALVERLAAALDSLARDGVAIAATTSRRTPPSLAQALRKTVENRPGWLWEADQPTEGDGAGGNPFFAMLGGADALVVTSDSVNMTSEACATGKPVYVASLGRLSSKLARFHQELASGGYTRPLPGAPTSAIVNPSDWFPERLDDVERASDAVIELLG